MAVNVAQTPDGNGVLLYNGEMILVYSPVVHLEFAKTSEPKFKGKKSGALYLTSHRIIFTNAKKSDALQSLTMPFHCLKDVKLEQPVFGANYLSGVVVAQPNGNWEAEAVWKLSFNKGGCIEFGQTLLRAAGMANSQRPHDAPPAYAPPAGAYFSPPPDYYTPQNGQYQGVQAPMQAFPDHPNPGSVYMYDEPPPYPGMGPPAAAPYPAGGYTTQGGAQGGNTSQPPPYPTGNAGPLPVKM